ncbi:hypothetical protein NMG60_11029434 [Bertholletia excelsa]
MPKRVCKFFARGTCLKGDRCKFSHDWKDPPKDICTFYQKGACYHGIHCRYKHVNVSQSSASSDQQFLPETANGAEARHADSVLSGKNAVVGASSDIPESSKPLFARGKMSRGETSRRPVGGSKSLTGIYAKREEHIKACEKKQKHIKALKLSQEIECSICLENVLSKLKPAERKFGILSECDHSFCISCIKNWRNSPLEPGMDVNSTLRACPVCRKVSYYIIPSDIWYSTKEEKQEIMDNYKAKLRSIDCKHFAFGNGICPFGTSCFYRHHVKEGSSLGNRALMPDMSGSNPLGTLDFLDYKSESSSDADDEDLCHLFGYLDLDFEDLCEDEDFSEKIWMNAQLDEDFLDDYLMAREMTQFLELLSDDSDDSSSE